MAQMESDRRQAEWLRVDFGIRETISPFGEIVEGEVECMEDSAAYGAGLRQGDVIQEVNRKPVASVDQFESAMHNASGGNILLLVNRNGFTQFIAIQK